MTSLHSVAPQGAGGQKPEQPILDKVNTLYGEWERELPVNWEQDLGGYVQRIRVEVPLHVSHYLDADDMLTEEYLRLTDGDLLSNLQQ